MPGSYDMFRQYVKDYIDANFNDTISILDVGPGSGTYSNLLYDTYKNIDAVEIFAPYIEKYSLTEKYRRVINENIVNYEFDYYDIIILGDVLEHLSIEDATNVLNKIISRCAQLFVLVPYLYAQGVHEDNVYEVHHQPDLTPDVMNVRFPQLGLAINNEHQGVYLKRKK